MGRCGKRSRMGRRRNSGPSGGKVDVAATLRLQFDLGMRAWLLPTTPDRAVNRRQLSSGRVEGNLSIANGGLVTYVGGGNSAHIGNGIVEEGVGMFR
jgi:hypothetical protein